MYVVICLDRHSIPSVSMFDVETEALEHIKHLAEQGANNIHLAKEIDFEIERKINVRLV